MAPSNTGWATTTEEMVRAGKHVQDVNEGVQADLRSLRGQLEPLRGAWRGAASVQFAQLMQRWDNDARLLNEALRSIGQAIDGSAVSYQAQDEAQSQSMSSISAALNG